MRSITWLCRSWGSRAMALPDRLREGDGADVHGVRDPVAHGDVEGRHRPIGLDDRGRRRRRHVREPRRRGELPQEGRIRLDVHRTPRDPGARSEEHTSELQSLAYLVCRLLLEKKKKKQLYIK